MPTAISETVAAGATQHPQIKKWNRIEYAAIEEAGLLQGQHVELIDGDLIDKMGKNRPHGIALGLMVDWLKDVFGRLFVQQEVSIDVAPEDNPSNEPEPDAIVLKQKMTTFVSSNPKPADLHLVVEIADSTLYYNVKTKASLYARAGILEYWVLDVVDRRLIVHRDPREGAYGSVMVYSEYENVAPLASPNSLLRIRDVLAE